MFKSYQDLVKVLKDQFSNPASIWLWRRQLCAKPRHLCKRLDLCDGEGMQCFIQGLHSNLKSHVILGQPRSLAEAESLANLKEAVLINTPNIVQQKIEVQLQSEAKNLEALAIAQQNKTPIVAAYNMHSRLPTPGRQHNSNYRQQSRQHSSDIGPQHDSSSLRSGSRRK